MPENNTSRRQAEKNVETWLRIHADAWRTGDDALRRQAVERIAYWTDEVLQHD